MTFPKAAFQKKKKCWKVRTSIKSAFSKEEWPSTLKGESQKFILGYWKPHSSPDWITSLGNGSESLFFVSEIGSHTIAWAGITGTTYYTQFKSVYFE